MKRRGHTSTSVFWFTLSKSYLPLGLHGLGSARQATRPAVAAGIFVIVVSLLALPPSYAAVKPTAYQGEPLPSFSLRDTTGDEHALSDYLGDVVLVNFWATWCAPCLREMPSMQRLERHLANRPFTILAVNLGEDPATLVPFIERLGIELTVLLDRDGTVARDWGVFAYPTTVLLDSNGRAKYIARGELDWAGTDARALIESMMPVDNETQVMIERPTPAPPMLEQRISTNVPIGTVRRLPPVAARNAREPDLAVTGDGTVVASWLETGTDEDAALRIARLGHSGWSPPVTVARGSNWFVNWADLPNLSSMGEDGLAVSWSVENGQGLYGYDLNVAVSPDGGKSWSEPLVPHQDGTPTQHGLASLAPMMDGRILVTWLDGRVNARADDTTDGADLPTDDMTLRATFVSANSDAASETLLDERVCSCCATAAVALDNGGALVAYRDRSEDDVRDIAVRRFRDGEWEPTHSVHTDGWRVAGCPINGPALSADGNHVAITWFTAANDRPGVLLAFSADGGDSFDQPVRIDNARPLGRTDVALLEDGSALVSWLEITAFGEELLLRRVTRDGALSRAVRVDRSSQGRTIGFPRMVIADDEAVIAWTVPGSRGSFGSAVLSIPTLADE